MASLSHQDGEDEDPVQASKRIRSSLSPASEVERVPRLDREFRRPPPPHQHKRRKPSRGHLQAAAASEPNAMDTTSISSGEIDFTGCTSECNNYVVVPLCFNERRVVQSIM